MVVWFQEKHLPESSCDFFKLYFVSYMSVLPECVCMCTISVPGALGVQREGH